MFKKKWNVIEVLQEKIPVVNFFGDFVSTEIAVYEILKSNKGKYKLKLSGFQPKKQATYAKAIKRINDLNALPQQQ